MARSTPIQRVVALANPRQWWSLAFLTDYLIMVLAYFLSTRIEHSPPFERDVSHYLLAADVSYPHLSDQVPIPMLFNLTVYLPLAIIFLTSLTRLSLQDLHHGSLALGGSRLLMKMVVEAAKNRVGRLRPDFLARCAWSILEGACTGPPALVMDGRKSFPSGHSGAAFQAMVVLSLFLAGKNGTFSLSRKLTGEPCTEEMDRCIRVRCDDASFGSTSEQTPSSKYRHLPTIPRRLDSSHVRALPRISRVY